MIKRLLAFAFILCVSISASAQTAKFSTGVKGIGVMNNMDIGLSAIGGGGGLFAGIRVANVVGLQGEVLYASTYGREDYQVGNSLRTLSLAHNYLLVPVVAQLWCGRNVALEAGYQQAIVVSGTLSSSRFEKEETGMFDYGSVIAGINFNLGKVVTLGARYTYGLDYAYIATKEPSKSHSVQVGLGFRFMTTRKTIFR